MRLSRLSALALPSLVHGYFDASPFFLFSTSELLIPTSQLSSSSSVTNAVEAALSRCPSDFYIIISQPGVTSNDYADATVAPTLSQRLSHHQSNRHGIRSTANIAEVVGAVDAEKIEELLRIKCHARVTDIDATTGSIPATYDMLPRVLNVYFNAPSGDRKSDLRLNDAFLASVLDLISSPNYTVLYTTTTKADSRTYTIEAAEYESEATLDQEPLHMGLRRDVSMREAKQGNYTETHRPLFERYQFFTPGIFMGFTVFFLLLGIAYVGVSALASLQVSYAAFDKESGQLATKKAQ